MGNPDTARMFWASRDLYPNYPHLLERRLMDTNKVVPLVAGASSVLDLGCADGYLLLVLREFTAINRFYGYDISENFIKCLENRWGDVGFLSTKVVDLVQLRDLPDVDVTLIMGALPYIFNDNDLLQLLKAIKSPELIVRAPCTMGGADEVINKFSEDLNAHYAAVYRTVVSYIGLLSECFTVTSIERAYPDSLESKYGTKQFFFICERD